METKASHNARKVSPEQQSPAWSMRRNAKHNSSSSQDAQQLLEFISYNAESNPPDAKRLETNVQDRAKVPEHQFLATSPRQARAKVKQSLNLPFRRAYFRSPVNAFCIAYTSVSQAGYLPKPHFAQDFLQNDKLATSKGIFFFARLPPKVEVDIFKSQLLCETSSFSYPSLNYLDLTCHCFCFGFDYCDL